MSLSRDFDRVTIEDDGTTIRVEATTSNEAGKPISPDPAQHIYIMLIALPDGDMMLTAEPAVPITQSSWDVRIEDGATAFAGVSEVLCVGIAIDSNGEPDVWKERRPLKAK
jgi:hypothetical protein